MIHLNGNNEQTSASLALITLKNVIKRFPLGDSEITVLKGISLEIKEGEFVSIVGPSGNGKTTLLNMITGIDRPSDGEVIVVEHPVCQMNEEELAAWRRHHVGIIFQFFQMLPGLSLLHNIILPMDFARKYKVKERKERAMHLLDQVGLADEANKLPGMVSGGQQQRAAIARALANDPPLIVADEPTGNLDVASADKIFTLFTDLVARNKTILMVTHNMELAERVPRLIELRNGRVVNDHNNSPVGTISVTVEEEQVDGRHLV